MSTEKFEKALKAIDRFNSQDPRQHAGQVVDAGQFKPMIVKLLQG